MNPRITISYDIEEDGAIKKKTLPLTIGIIGDFCGSDSAYAKTDPYDREFIPISEDSFKDIMKQISPSISFEIDSCIHPGKKLPISLSFHSITDFRPEEFAKRIPILDKLMTLRNQIKETQSHTRLDESLSEDIKHFISHYKELLNEL